MSAAGSSVSDILAFTVRYSSPAQSLKSKVAVCAHTGAETIGAFSNMAVMTAPQPDLDGLWDTGASCSVVTQAVVDRLNLIPVRWGSVSTPNGIYDTPFFYIYIGLPNHVIVGPLLAPLGNPSGCDVLIGMDVIGLGDFAVSNYEGRTAFTFRVPSIETVDYVKKARISNVIGPKHGKGKKKR
jgi:hypothetical protein